MTAPWNEGISYRLGRNTGTAAEVYKDVQLGPRTAMGAGVASSTTTASSASAEAQSARARAEITERGFPAQTELRGVVGRLELVLIDCME